MLPLDTVDNNGNLKDPNALASQLDQLKNANINGFMTDVWWGVTERRPKEYDFHSFRQLVNMAKERGMQVQFVTSFHACGGNVGDACNIPLPPFVHEASGIWYKDQQGNEDKEYISLFADNVPVAGRTPVEMYGDWFKALGAEFSADMGTTLHTLQIGLGPAGELRYPSYQLSHWRFCGVGAFQCWDEHALASLKAHANASGHPQWTGPPTDAGFYNSMPNEANFFNGGYKSEYGKYFLGWYSGALLGHGDAVLAKAREALGESVIITAKISGIHWWHNSEHHAAELTAGYYNADGHNAYEEIGAVVAKHKAGFDFTCLEMKDSEQSSSCASGPQELVQQVISASKSHGISFSGENALPRYDAAAYGQIEAYKGSLDAFTYLRLSPTLLQGDNFNNFKNFVGSMRSGGAGGKGLLVV